MNAKLNYFSLFLFLNFMCFCTFSATWELDPVVTKGLSQPVHVTTIPPEDTLYIVEQAGRILTHHRGKSETKVFLDIKDKVTSGGEMGLLSVAFHPDYKRNKKFYVDYTAKRPNLVTIIAEYQEGQKNEKEILKIDQPYSNHNGGQLLFDSEGYLLIAMGDGGSGGDPHGHGQNKKSLLGKILRIDINQTDPKNKKNYTIPPQNPFVSGGGLPEIFAYGLRNPWRVSEDRVTKALFTGDVGQNKYEEIDLIEKGKNYGWNVMEGKHCHKPEENCNQTGLTLPIHEYGREDGISITGGFVYRGKKYPDLYGVYVYGDYGSGNIWGLHYDQKGRRVIKNELLLASKLEISSFGEDADGEILVVSHFRGIYRLTKKA